MLSSYPVACPHEGCGWTGSLVPSSVQGGGGAEIASAQRAWFHCPHCQRDWEARISNDRVTLAPPKGPPPLVEQSARPGRSKVVALDVDPASLESLRQAFPRWQVEAANGVTAESLDRDWNPGPARLLVVGARAELAQTLGLCRGLRSQAGRAQTPLLVLVQPGQEPLVRAALDASADSCLVLPIHAKELVTMLSRALGGNRPGRHTLDLDQPQCDDQWQDDGGEA